MAAHTIAEILASAAAKGIPGRLVADGCRVAWDAATVAIFVSADERSVKLAPEVPFVLLATRSQNGDGGHRLHVRIYPREGAPIGLCAVASPARVAGLPVGNGGGFEVGLEPLTDLLTTLTAIGARVATSAGHAEAMVGEMPAPSLVEAVARRVELEPERPELDPTLSLEEVAARAAADERRRLLRAQAQSEPVSKDPSAVRVELKAARMRIAELESEVDALEQALAEAAGPGRELEVHCPSCETFGRDSMLRAAPVKRPPNARGLATMCPACGWLGVVVIAGGAKR